jgi:hypothetical protein
MGLEIPSNNPYSFCGPIMMTVALPRYCRPGNAIRFALSILASLAINGPAYAAVETGDLDGPKNCTGREGQQHDPCASKSRSNLNKWQPYIEWLGLVEGGRSLGQVDLFMPLTQGPDDLLFVNLRGHVDEQGGGEYNLGVGYRHQVDDWIYGVHGYFDRRITDQNNVYQQGAVGLEAMSLNWDLRFNVYLPEDKIYESVGHHVVISNDQIWVNVVGEKALPGVDGEIGWRVPLERYGDAASEGLLEDIRLFAGGYHYTGDAGFEDITGGLLRLEIGFDDLPSFGPGSKLTLGVETRYDEPRGSRTAGMLRLRVPFGATDEASSGSSSSVLTGLDRRMTTPVVRNTDIVVGVAHKKAAALNPAGDAYQRYLEFTNSAALENTAAWRNGADEVILANMQGGNDDANNWDMNDFVTAGDGVSYALAGKATPIGFISPFSGARRNINVTLAGTTPILDISSASSSPFTLSAGDHINGWSVDARGYDDGLLLTDTGQYYVTNSMFNNANQAGITVEGSLDFSPVLHVWNSEFSSNLGRGGAGGLDAQFGGVIYAYDVTLTDNGSSGVQARDARSRIYLRGGISTENGEHGVSASGGGHVYVTGMSITQNGQVGANANGNGSYLEISDSDVLDNGYEGVIANYGATTVATRLMVMGNLREGVASFGGTLTISDSTIAYNGKSGIYSEALNGASELIPGKSGNYFDDQANITATNVRIFGNGGAGVRNRGSDISISNSQVYDNSLAEFSNESGLKIDYPNENPHCIRDDGSMVVDGLAIAAVEVNPIPISASCDATPAP